MANTIIWKPAPAFARLLLTTGWLSIGFFLIGCGGSGGSDGAAPAPETFVFARGSDAQKLDPADIDDGESVNTLAQICEGLVRFRSGTLEIEPALAESYSISDDGLTYTFELREGVTFHDGTPLNAETAVFSFHRQMDPDHPGHLPGASFQYWGYLYQEVDSVEATGQMTVTFRLREPNAALLSSLAVFPAHLVSPGAFEKYGTDAARRPVGTGPYRFVRWLPNQAIILERNPDYWGDLPEFDQLTFKVVPDNTVRVLELRSGEVHGIDGVDPADLPLLKADDRFTVYRAPGMNVGYLAFNGENERFAEPEIREAIYMAIDREKLVAVGLDGAGTVAHYPVPPGFVETPDDRDRVPYDPDRARTALAEFKGRWATPIRLNVMNAPRSYFPDSVRAASLIRQDLEAVGLQVEIIVRDFKTHLDLMRNGAFEIGLIGWIGDNGDADNFLSIFFGSWAAEKGAATNFSFYRNPEMDSLLMAGRRTTDRAERMSIYRNVLAVWRRDLPILPLVHGDNIVVMRREVTDFRLQLIGDLRLGEIGWGGRGILDLGF